MRIHLIAWFDFRFDVEVAVIHCRPVRIFVFGALLVFLLGGGLLCLPSSAQEASNTDRERVTADRFFQVLLRRPRPGTALDRVYGYHVQNGSLDQLIESLDVEDDAPSAGEKAMILGLIQAQRGKSALAVDAFSKAEDRLPNEAACSFYLGKSLLAVGENERAAAAIQRSIDRGPARNEAVPIFTELGRIYGRAGQNEKAFAVWKQLETMFPRDASVGGQIARALAEEGNLEEALARFVALSKSSRDEDDKIAFAVEAAELRRRLGEPDEATKDLEKILARLRPGSWLHTDVRNRIEDGFLKSGDYDALANYYQGQLADFTDNLALQTRLGRILVSAGRLDEAKKTLLDATTKAPGDADVRLALIDVLVALGDNQSAAAQYETLAKNDPENPDYLLRWGQLLLEDQKTELKARREAASRVWQQLADARSDDAVTLSQIADRFRGIDREDDAIKLYEQAIEVDPESPQYREYLGEYLHKLDRKEEAIKTWESIASEDRRNRDSLVRLAEVFSTFELGERALAAWRNASEMDLTFAQELRFAKALRDAKQHEEAFARLEVARDIAETPDEQEQVLKDQIETYRQAGTLGEQIATLKTQPPTVDRLRQLALMHQAAGQLPDAAEAIRQARKSEPDNVDVLVVAADIAERQTRLSDAVTLFEKLSQVDTRFRTNYLQRVAGLQTRLGQIDEALATCESLIDANPASPESYLFYARTALSANRDDEAFTSLRRAMNVAPRDNGPRRMMASELAERYRTDEAIELYWQAIQYESQTDDRISLVKQLAPLYDRQGDIEELISRIESLGREDGDARETLLLTSAAYEAIEDYGAARQSIDQLIAQQPRDVGLLEAMVNLSDLADEVATAAEYQERIVALADTPENRFKLVQLKLDAGMIDIATALGERISLVSDPVRLGSMIRSAAMRGDTKAAIAICREALDRDPGLWDVKLELAQLLLYDDSDDDQKERYEEAGELCEQIRTMDLPLDAKPPTQKTVKTSSRNTNYPADYLTNPRYWGQNSYTMARNYRIGRYGNDLFGYSSGATTLNLIQPNVFGHARILAASLLLVRGAKEAPAGEVESKIEEMMKEQFSIDDIEEVDDAMVLWEYTSLQSFQSVFATNTNTNEDDAEAAEAKRRQEMLSWRLAELDPEYGQTAVLSLLASRIAVPDEEETKESEEDGEKEEQLEPLSTERLEILVDLFNKNKVTTQTTSLQAASSQLMLRSILINEFNRAGLPERAAEFAILDPEEDASYDELLSTLMFHLRMGSEDRASELVSRLIPAIRNETGGKATQTRSSINGSLGGISRASDRSKAFVDKHRLELLDAVLAASINRGNLSRSRNSSLSEGMLRTYYQSPTGSYRSIQIKAPLSTSLIDQSMVSELSSLIPVDLSQKVNARDRSLRVPLEMIEHLQKPLPDAPVHELKSRGVLAAFAHWWDDRPEDCYRELIELCEKYPDDIDLQIERARLASELNQPRVALEALDSFDPLDSRMLVRKEMAAMNLAAELGDIDRAKQAAQRLFGMRMDTNTQLALVDQLRRLGMNDKAAAVLRRMRGGKSRDESVELQIARSFMASDDKESAAEVAYALLRKMGSGRRQNQSNQDYYRRQAVEILTSAGRMEPLIERAERRLKASPSSMRVRSELAELYTAAGRSDDAEALWEDAPTDRPVDARQLLARAAALDKSKKHKEAAEMYLDAFEKDPSLINNSYYEMRRAVQAAKCEDAMFERLLEFDPATLSSYRLGEFVSMGDRKDFSEAKRKFIGHALKSPYGRQNFYSILRNVPDSERKNIPGIRETVVEAICSDDAFSPTSTLWQVRSRSSGGTAIGPLDDIIVLVVSDEAVANKFGEAAEKAKKTETSKPTAEFLLALMDLKKSEQKDKAAERLRNAIPKREEGEVRGAQAISGGLVWQAGQVIEKIGGIADRPAMLVEMYEYASDDPNITPNDFQYSVSARLLDVYAANGQSGLARQFALDGYASINNSEQNQYNPGYGDYQDLRQFKSIAEKLVSMGCPIDALVIYRRALSDPVRFERAKRYGSGTTSESFVKAAEAAAEAVTPKASTQYIQWLTEELAESKDAKKRAISVDLMDLPVEMLLAGDAEPGLTMAIRSSLEIDEGQEAVAEMASVLSDLSSVHTEDWSLPAAELLIAAYTDSEGIEPTAARLFEILPSLEEVTAAAGTPSTEKYKPLLDLYPVVKSVHESEPDADTEVGKSLIDYLASVAGTTGDPRLELALSKLTGDDSQSFANYLDRIEADVEPGAPLSKDKCETALGIARTAAMDGDIEISTRALMLALGNGPPLRQMGTTGDAFTISRQPTNVRDRDDGGMGELTRQVNEIIDLYSDSTGKKLGKRDPEPEDSNTSDSETGDVASSNEASGDGDRPKSDPATSIPLIFEALRTIVLPPERAATVFPYATEIVSTTGYDRGVLADDSGKESAAKSLMIAAVLCDRSPQLDELLQERIAKSTDKATSASLLVDFAMASKDEEKLVSALDSFAESLDSVLPEVSEITSSASTPNLITSQMQQESYRKSETINLVLGCIWPLLQDPSDLASAPQVAERAGELLQRTAALIDSDSYTSNRHRSIASKLRRLMLKSAAKSSDVERFQTVLDAEIVTREARYANYDGDRRDEYVQRELERLLGELIDDGSVDQTPGFIRKLIAMKQADDSNRDSMTPAKLAVAINELPEAKQFDLLMQIAMGDDADSPIMHWTGFVRYDTPPESVRRQTPRLEDFKSLVTSTSQIPTVDTLLMLADLAAKTNKSADVAEALIERSKRIGDDADIASALVRLAGQLKNGGNAESDSLLKTLDAIKADLIANKPTKQDTTLEYPMLATYLIARCIDAGVAVDQTKPLLAKLLPYATRSQRNTVTSALGRTMAFAGVGRAAGATEDSPLTQFVPVRLPAGATPDTETLHPLYAMDDEGWVSATSGDNQSLLMLRFPVVGEFGFSADIWDGNPGASNIGYGGVLYQPDGWEKKARITAMAGSTVKVSVPSIENGKVNEEALNVTENEVIGLCNGEPYVNDLRTRSYPWLSVTHEMSRTTRFNNICLTGNPVIPEQINPIDPTMRGWGILTYGRGLPDPLLPFGEGQDADKIYEARQAASEKDQAKWSVKDDELKYTTAQADNVYDPSSHIEYLRPLLDGDSMEYSFWWEWDDTEVQPTVGRMALKFTKDGTLPNWIRITNDLASTEFVAVNKLDPPADPVAPDNVPNDQAWNTVKLTRDGDTVRVTLNDKPLISLPVADPPRPGLLRELKRNVRIRDMKLTGDWPKEVPADLMERSTAKD